MKIMKLWSNDGQDYTWPVIMPEGMDDQTAWLKAKQAIRQAQDANPTEGFQVVPYVQGPLWD